MALYMIMYEDWHKEYRMAKSNKDAENIGSKIYNKSKVWYTMEM